MSSRAVVRAFWGWEERDSSTPKGIHAFGWETTSDPLDTAAFSFVAPTSPPSGVNMGGYCLFYDGATTIDTSLTKALGTIEAVGFMWRPITGSTIFSNVPAHIMSWDAGALGGICIGLDASEHLLLCSQSTADVYATSNNTYGSAAWYWLALTRDNNSGRITLYIHSFAGGNDINVVPDEILEIKDTTITGNMLTSLRIGQTAGTSNCSFQMDNMYAHGGTNAGPPLAPSMDAETVTAVSTGDSVIVPSGGTDSDSTEHQEIDETPGAVPDDTDYVKKTASGLFTSKQIYAVTNFGLSSVNVLAVGATSRAYGTHTVFTSNLLGWDLSGTIDISSFQPPRFALHWYYASWFVEVDPSGADWTTSNVDATEYWQGFRNFQTNESRNSQAILTVAYVDDDAWIHLAKDSGYEITAPPSTRRIFIT